jgi:hypothetical protein
VLPIGRETVPIQVEVDIQRTLVRGDRDVESLLRSASSRKPSSSCGE